MFKEMLGVVNRVHRLLQGWEGTLPDSLALPSAGYTRQRPVCTRQTLCRVLHSANATRQSLPRQRDLCRVSDFGHSAKTLPRALALGKAATWHHAGPAFCRVPNGGHSAKLQTLPSVGVWHSAKCRPRVAPRGRFAECWILALGKRLKLCRVPEF